MVSTMQQHEHCDCASHATCSELTLAVAALLCAVKRLLSICCRQHVELYHGKDADRQLHYKRRCITDGPSLTCCCARVLCCLVTRGNLSSVEWQAQPVRMSLTLASLIVTLALSLLLVKSELERCFNTHY